MPPIQRYEHDATGGMLHLNIQKLGRFECPSHRVTADRTVHTRGVGWEYVHIIDDHTRLATASVLSDETARSTCRALLDVVRYYRRLGIRHNFTKPYTLRTNGMAERFIQTALREWACACAWRYESSDQRAEQLPGWLHCCNLHRPHAGPGYLSPVIAEQPGGVTHLVPSFFV